MWWTSLLQQVTKFRSSYSFGKLLRILIRAVNLFSFSHIVSCDSSFNIHNTLYFVKYPSRAAQNSPDGRGLKTPGLKQILGFLRIKDYHLPNGLRLLKWIVIWFLSEVSQGEAEIPIAAIAMSSKPFCTFSVFVLEVNFYEIIVTTKWEVVSPCYSDNQATMKYMKKFHVYLLVQGFSNCGTPTISDRLKVVRWYAIKFIKILNLKIRQNNPSYWSCGLNGTKSRVRVGRQFSDTFAIHNGLKKGDALSPLLFNFY